MEGRVLRGGTGTMKKIEALRDCLESFQLLIGILSEQSTDERVFKLQTDIESDIEALK